MPREYLTTAEVACEMRVHPETVYRKLRTGELPGVKLGKKWFVRRDLFDAYMVGGRVISESPA